MLWTFHKPLSDGFLMRTWLVLTTSLLLMSTHSPWDQRVQHLLMCIKIVNASRNQENRDTASLYSTLTVNILALKEARVSNVSCGLFSSSTRRFIDVTFNSSGGKLTIWCRYAWHYTQLSVYHVLVPPTPTGISAQPKYNILTEIDVLWNEVVS